MDKCYGVFDVAFDTRPFQKLEGVPTVNFSKVSEALWEYVMEELRESLVSPVVFGDLHHTLGEFVAPLAYRAGWAEGPRVGYEDGGHPHAIVVLHIEALDLKRVVVAAIKSELNGS